jgi:hypothetical protein
MHFQLPPKARQKAKKVVKPSFLNWVLRSGPCISTPLDALYILFRLQCLAHHFLEEIQHVLLKRGIIVATQNHLFRHISIITTTFPLGESPR